MPWTLVPHTNRPKPTLNPQGHAGRNSRLWLHPVATCIKPGKLWTQNLPSDGWMAAVGPQALQSETPVSSSARHWAGSNPGPGPKPVGGHQPQDHPSPVASHGRLQLSHHQADTSFNAAWCKSIVRMFKRLADNNVLTVNNIVLYN